jgi:predicted outer membrane repeat protein
VVTASNVSNAAVLNGFTVTGGQATDPDNSPDQGAGIYNINASPTLANLLITGNTAQYGGAGMYNQGTSSPSVFAVTFRRNDVMSYGGGVYNEDSSSPTLINVSFISNTATYGGGFFNGGGTLTLSLVQFQENRAGRGGAIFNDTGSIQLMNASFISNTAYQYGGGIWTFEGGLTVVNSEFRNNQANGSGGAIYSQSSEIDITDSSCVNNSVCTSPGCYGGGLYHGKLTRETVARLTNVTFEGNNNVGGLGGGMYVFQASAQLDKVRFVNNVAAGGGGMSSVFGKSIVLTDTVFIGNTAIVSGGGMSTLLTERDMTLTNVLFSGNTSLQDGGGMRNENAAFRDAKFTLTNVTFSGNTAQNRGGALLNIAETITLTNVIIWGNTASINSGLHNDSSDLLIAHSDVQGCGGSSMWNSACGIDGGGNIDTDPLFVDANGPDDLVGTLDDDLRLQTSSPAIDAGNNAVVPDSLSTDLDGNLRIQDGDGDNSAVVDMGAYEAEDVYPPTVISVTRGDANPTNAASVTFIVNFSEPVIGVDATDFTVTTTGVSGAAVSSVSGSGTTYIVTVSTGSGDGMLRLDIPTSAMISDVVGNGLTGLPYQAGEAYTIDKTGPTVDLEQAAEQADPTNTTPISFTVVFNEPINAATFSASDVALDWSASGEITATVAEIAPFNGTVFRIAVSGMDRSGVITVSIPAGMIEDLIGNLNLASTSMDNTVTYWDPNSDSDGDGLNDWDEVQLGTNPNASDSDGDGMPDGWEVANGLNPTNPGDASEDSDGDGQSNLQEYLNGTDPNVSDSLTKLFLPLLQKSN